MSIEQKRHSYSHVLAQAVKRVFGNDIKMGIGPAIENGFYYDFDFGDKKVGEEDLTEIQKTMKKIVKENQQYTKLSADYDIAKEILIFLEEDLKIDLLEDMKDEKITFFINTIPKTAFDNLLREYDDSLKDYYKKLSAFIHGLVLRDVLKLDEGELDSSKIITFVDMCAGPHVQKTNELSADSFKIDRIAGAYWKGNSNNQMLTRVYGLAFETKEELKEYINKVEEMKKRDHRLLGKKLDLFCFNENVGLGLPLWHPMGGRLWRNIEDYWILEHQKNGYEFVRTPHIGNQKLWEISGHWGFYSDSMYPPLEVGQTLEDEKEGKKVDSVNSEKYLLKPMNCPFHVEIYKSRPRSYREFPLKWAELGTVYRFEKKGQLGGLTRVRGFTQDDAHIFCRRDQVKQELSNVVDFIDNILSTFGIKYEAFLSFRDPESDKYVGTNDMWEYSQKILEEISNEKGLNAPIEIGEAAFYGPKIDFKLKDCLGRTHQCSTVQFDFNLPERFELSFTNNQGENEQPYMIHRALLGSFERFIAVIIEHYGGVFPLWLAPRQAIIVPVVDKFDDYAKKVNEILLSKGIKSEIDYSSDSLNKKIRNAEKSHINYILVVGEKEVESDTLAVRNLKSKEQTIESINDFVERIKTEISDKKI